MSAAITLDPPASRARANEVLTPYVPRLVVDWLRETPTALHREVEGSLVFVDISGFTALSERLAKKGKIGAELMRDTLNGVFGALLDEAYDYGAGLLKWGGDALLLLFDGADHEQRACRAAWEMQRALDRVGRLKAGGGTITLRMSVGISTGTYQFFMTGSVHRELLIAGPGATETVTMEAIADAGEIALSPLLASRLARKCVGAAKEEAILLSSPPEAEAGRSPAIGDVSTIDIPSCIPIASRAHVLLETSEPEHRTITAAFIDLMDTDQLLERLGIDALAEALDERLRTIQEVALRFEVPFYESDVGKGSVKALLTAGAPSSTGHDEERMLRALREIMDVPGVVPMRIGVNTGKVFTGDFGPPYRRSYRVFGDAINTAARVMSKAEAGQILSTEIVLERSRTTFAMASIEPFAAKGKSEPVRASIVREITGTKDVERSETPLVGREVELEAVLGVIARARRGEGWVVEVAGGAGNGKSRLVEEVRGRSGDVTVLHTWCEEYEASTPYFAFRRLLRGQLGIGHDADSDETEQRLREVVERVDPSLVPWIPLLGILLGLDLPDTPQTAALDESFLRDRLAEVTMQLLFTMLAGTPTMIAVEDVHFMDEASRDLLLRLARANAELRHVILVTNGDLGSVWAPTDDDLIRTLALCLLPLPFTRMVEIAERLTEDDPLQPHELEEIARRSGGNPLFLEELLDTLRRTGAVDALPDSVESLIAGQIDRLSPQDRAVLRYAAVLGTTFEPRLLGEAVRGEATLDDGVWERLSELVERDSSVGFRFRNALIRDAAYEGLPYRRRRTLHGRIGEAIEATAGVSLEEEIGTLALHFHAAQRWDKAWEYCRKAGDRAMEIYANVEAARFYERALGAGRRMRSVGRSDLAEVHELLGDVHWRLGEYAMADASFRSARKLFGHLTSEAGRVAVKECRIPAKLGLFPQALNRTTRALKALDGQAGRAAAELRAEFLVLHALVNYWQGRTVDCIEWCRRGEREARRARADAPLAAAYQLLDFALRDNDELDKAVYSERALALWEKVGNVRQQALTLNNLGVIAKDRADWSESRRFYDRALHLFEEIGDRWAASLAKYNIAEMLIDQGLHDDAEPLLREVLRVWRAQGTTTDVAEAERELGKLMARRGAIEAAAELFASARAEQVSHGQSGEVLATDARIAEMFLLAGEGARALDLVTDALARAEATSRGNVLVPTFQRLRCWALIQEGRINEASEALDLALALARERADDYELALTLDVAVTFARISNSDFEELESERHRTLEHLAVVVTPAIPVEVKTRKR